MFQGQCPPPQFLTEWGKRVIILGVQRGEQMCP